MKKNDYVNLASMSDLFDNKTLTYRINGFACACNMENIGIVRNGGVLFNTKNKNGDIRYYIVVNKNDNYEKGNSVTISGYYGDLNFNFTNYYGNRKNLSSNQKRILELPFSVSLFKSIDNDTYHLKIETVNKEETKFIITKSREYKNNSIMSRVSFYANVSDFSVILKLIKSFVYNPILVFNTYNEIKEQKKVAFVLSELDRAIMQDEDLDKPLGKVKKIIKKITNSK